MIHNHIAPPNQEIPGEWLQALGDMTYGLYVVTAGTRISAA
jgi:hypothetical protein